MATLPRLALAALLLSACHAPSDDYQRFLDATAASRGATVAIADSHFEDLSGKWLVNTLLAGGLALGLRMRFSLDLAQDPIPLSAEFWLAASDTTVDPPLTTVQTILQKDGRFVLAAVPLVLAKGSVKGLNVDVSSAQADQVELGPHPKHSLSHQASQ